MSRFDIITIIGHSRKRANRLMTQRVADLPDTAAGRAVADGLEWCAKLELEADGAEVMQSTGEPATRRMSRREKSGGFSLLAVAPNAGSTLADSAHPGTERVEVGVLR